MENPKTRIKAVRRDSPFGKIPNNLEPEKFREYANPRELLERVSAAIGVCSIAMDRNGLWYFGRTKLALMEKSGGWYSPAGTIPVPLGMLRTNVDWTKSLEVL